MTNGLSDELLSLLSRIVVARTGLHFPRERWSDLERGFRSVCRTLGYSDVESCAQWLLSASLGRKEIEILASELTVGETYFFREKQSFDILTEQILPEIVRIRQGTDRRLRIWSAGCCTGEEAYSLAILLDRFLSDLPEWQITILGTDINPRFLQKATEGIYSAWSFRDSPSWLKTNYFNPIGDNRFQIIPRIKEMVSFAYLNLAEDSYPSLGTNTNAMDLIFCRNVLMYFNADGTKRVVRHFRRSLVDQGWLIVSPTETSMELFAELLPVRFPQMTFYQKGEKTPVKSAIPTHEVRWEEQPAPVELPAPADFLPSLSPPEAEPEPELIRIGLYDQALLLFESGNYTGAAEILTVDLVSPQPAAETPVLLARIHANLGNLAEAQSWTEKALLSDKLNAGLHYLRAIIAQEQGTGEEVIPSLKRALYLEPNFVLAHFALGNVVAQRGNLSEAHRHFMNVLDLLADYQPDDPLPHADGLLAGRLKEMVTASLAMEKAA